MNPHIYVSAHVYAIDHRFFKALYVLAQIIDSILVVDAAILLDYIRCTEAVLGDIQKVAR